jgi:hypothetical protein
MNGIAVSQADSLASTGRHRSDPAGDPEGHEARHTWLYLGQWTVGPADRRRFAFIA